MKLLTIAVAAAIAACSPAPPRSVEPGNACFGHDRGWMLAKGARRVVTLDDERVDGYGAPLIHTHVEVWAVASDSTHGFMTTTILRGAATPPDAHTAVVSVKMPTIEAVLSSLAQAAPARGRSGVVVSASDTSRRENVNVRLADDSHEVTFFTTNRDQSPLTWNVRAGDSASCEVEAAAIQKALDGLEAEAR